MNTYLKNGLTLLVTILVTLGAAEGIIRLKNANMKNYDIEMWKYARELKTPDPLLGHVHVPNRSAVLESVQVSINGLGMRGPMPQEPAAERRILFLGSSITLGWGVEEEKTMTSDLLRRFKEEGADVEILNGAVGNYNANRYVELFFRNFTGLNPTDIVVHYFINDAEILPQGGGNWFLRHSQLAVTLWIAAQRVMSTGGKGLIDHYKEVYDPSYEGYKEMSDALRRLSQYAKEHGIRLYLAMSPDIHFLTDYPFTPQHTQVGELARSLGYTFIDLYPPLQGIPFQELQAMPGDAHPNARGHKLMADAIYPVLKN